MDLELLRTVVAIHRAGSLTGAAAQLGRSQPTVTAQLRSLERQLGQQLFERAPRGVLDRLSGRGAVLVADDGAEIGAMLDAFDAGALLLRPDRYVLGAARNPNEMRALADAL